MEMPRRDGGYDTEVFPTSHELVDKLVPCIMKVCSGRTFVDSSAGDGYLAARLSEKGVSCLAFDIQQSPETYFPVRIKDWFRVRKRDLQHETNGELVIGFNPPFGYRGKVANEFIEHARLFNPVAFCMILPWASFNKGIAGYTMTYSMDVTPDFDVAVNAWFGIFVRDGKANENLKVQKHEDVQWPDFVLEHKMQPKGIFGWDADSIQEDTKHAWILIRAIGAGRGMRGAFRTSGKQPQWESFDFVNPAKHFIQHQHVSDAVYGVGSIESFIVLKCTKGTSRQTIVAAVKSVKDAAQSLGEHRRSFPTSMVIQALRKF